MSHGSCSYIFMYLNTVANSVMVQLYLKHNFYNLIFQIKPKLYIASGSAPPPKPTRLCLSRKRREILSYRVKVYLYIVLLHTLTKLELYGPILVKFPEIKLEIKQSIKCRMLHADRQIDKAKPIVAFTKRLEVALIREISILWRVGLWYCVAGYWRVRVNLPASSASRFGWLFICGVCWFPSEFHTTLELH